MDSGLLNQKIEFHRLVLSHDDYGHETYDYEFAFATRANVVYNNGNRVIENQEIFYDNSISFKVRFYVPLEDTMRIKYRDKWYRILAINDIPNIRNQKIILCELINE